MSHDEFPTENPAVVTCGLPYANGDLHVGHLRTYVDGDAFGPSKRPGQGLPDGCRPGTVEPGVDHRFTAPVDRPVSVRSHTCTSRSILNTLL